MGPSERSFEQVRSILSKLGRDIDSIRNQRTQPPTPPKSDSFGSRPGDRAGERLPERAPERVQASPQPQQARPASNFGRATPLPPRS
jgi:hypothetical protein